MPKKQALAALSSSSSNDQSKLCASNPAPVEERAHQAYIPVEQRFEAPAPLEVPVHPAYSTVNPSLVTPAPVEEVESQFLLTNEDFQLSDEDIQNYLTGLNPEEENVHVDVDDDCEIIYVKPGEEFDYSKVKVKVEPVD